MTSPAVRRQTGHLEPDVAGRVIRLAAQAEEVDGVEALGEQTVLNLRDPLAEVHHLLATAADGTPVGYAQLEAAQHGGTASAELVVAPEHRRRGLGSRLLAGVLDQAADGGARAAVWAHGNLPAARALASGAGLGVVRELWKMSADLGHGHATAPSAPPGVVVRPFVVGQDEEAWLRVNARAFADHPEQGRMTMKDLVAREREDWFSAQDVLLAEQDGRLLASVWMKVEPGSDAGELYVLGVDPDAQGMGLGRLLTAMTLDHLAGRRLQRVDLYTSATNEAAVRTYRSAGFSTSRIDVQYG